MKKPLNKVKVYVLNYNFNNVKKKALSLPLTTETIPYFLCLFVLAFIEPNLTLDSYGDVGIKFKKNFFTRDSNVADVGVKFLLLFSLITILKCFDFFSYVWFTNKTKCL